MSSSKAIIKQLNLIFRNKTKINEIVFSKNPLTYLNTSNTLSIQRVCGQDSDLAEVDLSQNANLVWLDPDDNQLSSWVLPVKVTLWYRNAGTISRQNWTIPIPADNSVVDRTDSPNAFFAMMLSK